MHVLAILPTGYWGPAIIPTDGNRVTTSKGAGSRHYLDRFTSGQLLGLGHHTSERTFFLEGEE